MNDSQEKLNPNKLPIFRWLIVISIPLWILSQYSSFLPEESTHQEIKQEKKSGYRISLSYQERLNKQSSALQAKMDSYMQRYQPKDAAWLAVDLKSGAILAWKEANSKAISSSNAKPKILNKASFPVASLFKTVTAAAAFQYINYNSNSQIQYISSSDGKLHEAQLKNNIKSPYSDIQSIKTAFARSNNYIFGRLGVRIGSKHLKRAAFCLGYDQLLSKANIEKSTSSIPKIKNGARLPIGKTASGFTSSNKASPLHIAAQTRSILKKEPLELPWGLNKSTPFLRGPTYDSCKFSNYTYNNLQSLFEGTTNRGTASRRFEENIPFNTRRKLITGGKTGTLQVRKAKTKGLYDWFTGYAIDKSNPEEGIIIVIIQIHPKERVSYRASGIASLLINDWKNWFK